MPKLSWTGLRWLVVVAFGFSLALAGAWVFWAANPGSGSHGASAVTVTSITPRVTRPASGAGTAVKAAHVAAAATHSGEGNADLNGSDPGALSADAGPARGFDDAASLNTSAFKNVVVDLTVHAANQMPSFTKGADQRVVSRGGARSVANWARAISQGRGESGQRVSFIVTNTNNAVFSVQPVIGATGTLTYTPGDATGVARVSVRIHDNGGTAHGGFDTSAVQRFTITVTAPPPADLSGPTGGFVDASGLVGTGARYSTSATLRINLSKGTDPSGVAPTNAYLSRATATLTSAGGIANGTCGTFGDYALVSGGTDPASPKADTVADQACYRYQYVVADRLRNRTTYTSGDVKVDSSAPATPALTFSAFSSTYWAGGSTVFYRSAASTGSVTLTGVGSDAESGIAGFDFPALGAGWTSTPGSLGVNTYSWASLTSQATGTATPGTTNVTMTNNATGASRAPFTLIADDTAPTGATVTYPDGAATGSTVSVSFTAGGDGGSGIGAAVLQRASATLTGATCGAYGSFSTVTNGTNPISPLVDTVTTGNCYRYQYLVYDNLGNGTAATSANVVKVGSYVSAVTNTTGLVGYWRLGESSGSTIVDSFGTNPGTFGNSPTLGAAGAIAGDSNTAATFNGSNQYGTVARQIQDDFSIEFWFKSTQDVGSGCWQWYQGQGLVDAEVGGVTDDFGVALCGGTVVAGVGNPDVSIVSLGGYNDGAWHHVVFTRTMMSGVTRLYLDGALAGTETGGTGSLTAPDNIALGRLQTDMQYFDGTLDEIAVYNTVLSPATVTNHYGWGTGLIPPG